MPYNCDEIMNDVVVLYYKKEYSPSLSNVTVRRGIIMSNTKVVSNMISPKVHRYLYPYAIRKFLGENKIQNTGELIEEIKLDKTNPIFYSQLLDALISRGEIEEYKVNDFLINELNYGRARNVYVSFFNNATHLSNEEEIYKFVRSLEENGYKTAEKVNTHPYVSNLRRGIPKGDKELIYFDIEKDGDNYIKNIKLLLGECVIKKDRDECNNYFGIEINLELKMLVIKLRNWENQLESNYSLDYMHDVIKRRIKSAFRLFIPSSTTTMQELMYNMINDLSSKVLRETFEHVNDKIEENVEDEIRSWSKKISNNEIEPPRAELDVIKKTILNNFYKMYMHHEVEELHINTLKETFKVDGYPRYVKFIDDTVSEGRARSSDPDETLLETSIFYDIKARLDQAKHIRLTTIYWINFPGYTRIGTTFYTESLERFKFIALPNYFNEEMCNYVLRQIDKYRPSR